LPEMVLIVFILGVANNPDVDLSSEPRIPIDCRGSRPDRWEGSAQGKPASFVTAKSLFCQIQVLMRFTVLGRWNTKSYSPFALKGAVIDGVMVYCSNAKFK